MPGPPPRLRAGSTCVGLHACRLKQEWLWFLLFFFFPSFGKVHVKAIRCVNVMPMWSLSPCGFSWSCWIPDAWGARGPVCKLILGGELLPFPRSPSVVRGGCEASGSTWVCSWSLPIPWYHDPVPFLALLQPQNSSSTWTITQHVNWDSRYD